MCSRLGFILLIMYNFAIVDAKVEVLYLLLTSPTALFVILVFILLVAIIDLVLDCKEYNIS